MRIWPIMALVIPLLAAPPALAHKLKVFATREGGDVVGMSYFAGGEPVVDLDGQALDGAGIQVGTPHTDSQGRFRLALPAGGPLRIRFDTGDGHVAEAVVDAPAIGAASGPAAPQAGTVGATLDTAAMEQAIARQITPLREQLDAMDARARLSDIVGGLGLIFGLFGCAAWIASRRPPKS